MYTTSQINIGLAETARHAVLNYTKSDLESLIYI